MLYSLAPWLLLWLDAEEYYPEVFVLKNAPLGWMQR